jgi:hypothetical protein
VSPIGEFPRTRGAEGWARGDKVARKTDRPPMYPGQSVAARRNDVALCLATSGGKRWRRKAPRFAPEGFPCRQQGDDATGKATAMDRDFAD